MAYPLTNVLLDALPEESRRRIMAHLRAVALPVRTSLYEPDDLPKYVHFLTSGIASIVASMKDGESTEVGTTGREGLPQALHLMGTLAVPTRGFMQVAGTGLRMDFKKFEQIFATDEHIRQVVLAYTQSHCVMVSQVAACNRMHSVEARLARWLLMIHDRTSSSVLKLTQEFLAQMIGSQRTTVGAVAGALQDEGLIEYSRGTIRLLDRVGLEQVSCECYPVTRRLLDCLYARASQRVLVNMQ